MDFYELFAQLLSIKVQHYSDAKDIDKGGNFYIYYISKAASLLRYFKREGRTYSLVDLPPVVIGLPPLVDLVCQLHFYYYFKIILINFNVTVLMFYY